MWGYGDGDLVWMDVTKEIKFGWMCRRISSVVDLPTELECGWMYRQRLSVDGCAEGD